jgi:hypothetical protein
MNNTLSRSIHSFRLDILDLNFERIPISSTSLPNENAATDCQVSDAGLNETTLELTGN